jgi:hypothetical protein
MAEKPILFTGAMVRAILAGQKTQTRRLVTAQSIITRHPDGTPRKVMARPKHVEWFQHQNGWLGSFGEDAGASWNPHRMVPCPYGVPGDRLWVRETHRHFGNTHTPRGSVAVGVRYRADDSSAEIPWMRDEWPPVRAWWNTGRSPWTPGIHMPRWACRLVLEVTAVRVERLQAITADDAKAEGVPDNLLYLTGKNTTGSFLPRTYNLPAGDRPSTDVVAVANYAALWSDINGRESWEANPWVWVVEFQVIPQR